MTKAELIGLAYLKLTDNFPTMDNAVWWDDVELLLAPAVNYVINGDYFIGKREEGEDKILQPLFIQTFMNVPITYDKLRKKRSFILPKKPIALPKNRAVPFVGTADGKQFIPVEQSGGAMQDYFKAFKQDQTSYELEGTKGILHNCDPLLQNLMVKEIVSVSDIGDDEDILLPDGAEIQIAELMVKFFTKEQPLPKDYYNSGKEPQIK